MSKKKIISLCLVVCLLATAIGGTLAYFTDTDDEVNVFTLGNVQIDLVEQQRNAEGNALEDFKDNNEPLVPMARPTSAVNVGGHYLPDAKNFVDKIVTVDNDGNVDAYVRVLLAVPEEMNDERDEVMLHLVSDGEETKDNDTTVKWSRASAPSAVITLGGLDYSVYSFTYGSALAAGATTKYPVITGVYLDKNVDATVNETTGAITYSMGDNRSVTFNADDGLKLYVLAQGVQADGFTTADAALNEGFGEVTVANAQTWFDAVS